MPATIDRQTARDRMRTELVKVVGELDADVPAGFTRAVRSFLTALEYDDPALVRSHLHAALEALVGVTDEAVRRRLGWPERIEAPCRALRELAEQAEPGQFDDLGRETAARFDRMIAALTDLRDGPVKLLLDHGYEVGAADQLDRDVRALMRLKEDTLGNWPWSVAALPPLDRQMLAESRAAFQRGEPGEPVEELIGRLGGGTANE